MNPAPTLSPSLRGLLILCDEVAVAHGLPMEAFLLQTLAHASALAGHLITSSPTEKIKVPAKFSLIIRTPDPERPAWISAEISHLLNRQAEILHAAEQLGPVAALRRKKKVIDAIAGEERFRGPGCIDDQIALAKRRATFRFIHQVDRGRSAWSKRSHLVSLVASGYPALRKIPNGTVQGPHARHHGTTPAELPNVVGWISSVDWDRLIKDTPPSLLPQLGWIVECGASNFDLKFEVTPRLVAPAVLQRMEISRLGEIRFAFNPSEPAKALLARQEEQVREILDNVPFPGRELLIPDPFLAWHLAALLVAISGHGKGDEFSRSEIQCCRVACALASWVVARHVHDVRHSFPGDGKGTLSGQDLSALRFLTMVPAPVRNFQRRLRRVDRDSCLRSLRRLVQAGLALESDRQRFASIRPPDHGNELSEFLSEFDPVAIFPLRGSGKSTAYTDRSASPLSHPASQGGTPAARTQHHNQQP